MIPKSVKELYIGSFADDVGVALLSILLNFLSTVFKLLPNEAVW